MPELPDVERYRRRLAAHGAGREIRRVSVTDAGVLRNTTSRQLGRALEGRRFGGPRRHGKWLIAPTTGPILLLHFGMTGDLICASGGEGRHPHDRVVFALDRGEIRFRMMRKLGGLWLADGPRGVERTLDHLGPDALGIGRDRFLDLLAGRRGRVKAALLDQRLVAGVGNILADEALWRARLHPATRIDEMPESERARLHAALQGILREAVDEEGIEWGPGWLARVRDRPGARCPRCRATLVRASVGGRTAVLCPRCQPGPGR